MTNSSLVVLLGVPQTVTVICTWVNIENILAINNTKSRLTVYWLPSLKMVPDLRLTVR